MLLPSIILIAAVLIAVPQLDQSFAKNIIVTH
jgi:hypothetical protein